MIQGAQATIPLPTFRFSHTRAPCVSMCLDLECKPSAAPNTDARSTAAEMFDAIWQVNGDRVYPKPDPASGSLILQMAASRMP